MKTKTLIFVLILVISGIKTASSQCTVVPFTVPNPSAGAISPHDVHFCVNDLVSYFPYQVLPMSQYLYSGTMFEVDSFVLISINGMPGWADYVCRDPQCMFRAGIWTCMALNITGTVPNVLGTDTVKLYKLTMKTGAWARAGGVPITMNIYPEDTFRIWVHAANSYRWWGNNGYHHYNKISGKVYYDQNHNGTKDSSEVYISNQRVFFLPDSAYLYTNYYGEYRVYVDSGNYSIQYVPTGFWELSSANGYYNIHIDTTDAIVPDIGVKAIDTMVVSVRISSGITRCNTIEYYWLTVSNEGTDTANGIVGFRPDHLTSLSSANPVFDSIANGQYFWRFNHLIPGQYFRVIANHLCRELLRWVIPS